VSRIRCDHLSLILRLNSFVLINVAFVPKAVRERRAARIAEKREAILAVEHEDAKA
jgi:hypothetical protein